MVAISQYLLFALTASLASAAPKPPSTPAPGPASPRTPSPDPRGTVYRGDRRSPGTVEDAGGFSTWANTNNKPPNMNLLDHAKKPNPDPTQRNDGFVSTSSDKRVAQDFAPDGYVYSINKNQGPPGYTDVNKALGDKSPVPFEKEQAARGSIPASAIMSADKMKDGEVVGTKKMAPQQPPA
ncbi:hypothetical protein CAC42_4777 [Sphaceloma murrayae]|uniref:Uncharacterized protein n=1 Tax=Sphaceloma murrayae TaxID=2082308 RepID=A0A2K1QPK8_9PEZI|nr:hypothetical protein CAC42_4777 [Sphaceloma murrayae]